MPTAILCMFGLQRPVLHAAIRVGMAACGAAGVGYGVTVGHAGVPLDVQTIRP